MSMVTAKTAELEGAALDWAVAKAIGETNHIESRWYDDENGAAKIAVWCSRQFSSDWSQGGPLIDKYNAALNGGFICGDRTAFATVRITITSNPFTANGPTNLIAVMRAIVAAELGETVEIPAELIQ